MVKDSSTRRLAVVTGASSGIGYELAKEFAEHGFDLVIAAEDPGIVEVKQAMGNFPVNVESVQVDLATPEGVETLYERIKSLNRPVNALAVNAGIGVSGEFVRDTKIEDEVRLINLNVISAVHLTKLVAKDMVAVKDGHILFTSSVAATAPGPYYAVYAASKAFLQSFAEAIRFELKDTGVTVTSLMPGSTDTNFFVRAGMLDTKVNAGPKDSPAEVAREGFEALMANKDHVVAGSFKNMMQAFMARFLPEQVKAGMQAQQTKPGSAHP